LPPPMVLVSENLQDRQKEGGYIHGDVCKSQGETLIIVAITTFVNLLFIGVILLCRGCLCHDFFKGGGDDDSLRRLVIDGSLQNIEDTEAKAGFSTYDQYICCQDANCVDAAIMTMSTQQKLADEALRARIDNCPLSA